MDSHLIVPELHEKLTFTYAEAAKVAGISVSLVRKLVANGQLQKIKIGRCARVPRRALLRLCGTDQQESK